MEFKHCAHPQKTRDIVDVLAKNMDTELPGSWKSV